MTRAPNAPRQRRKDARPAEIIDAGMAEFAEKGYDAARLSDVARRAGIAKGTIYLYFESKEKLFEAAVLSRIRSRLSEFETLIDTYEGSSETLLDIVISKLYQQMVLGDSAVLMRIIVGEGHRFPNLTRFYYDTVLLNGTDVVTRLVRRGISRGEFREGGASEYPRLIVAPAIMATIWRMTFDPYEPLDLDTLKAAHLDLLLNGLRAERQSG